jgi:Ni,Fe-hydrogenase maturation factor
VRRLVGPGAAGGDDDDAGGAGGGVGAGAGPTSHHVGPGELVSLAAQLYGAAPEVAIVSVGVATMELAEELSPAVAAALPAVADAVAELVTAHEGRAG